MAVTAFAYGPLGLRLGKGEIDFTADDFKVTLHASGYTPNKDHDYFDDVTNEVVGTGYVTGGESLTGMIFAYVSGSDWSALTADATVWNPATVTYRYAVLRKDTGTAGTSPLVLCVDFGSDQVVAAGEVMIDWQDILRLVA